MVGNSVVAKEDKPARRKGLQMNTGRSAARAVASAVLETCVTLVTAVCMVGGDMADKTNIIVTTSTVPLATCSESVGVDRSKTNAWTRSGE